VQRAGSKDQSKKNDLHLNFAICSLLSALYICITARICILLAKKRKKMKNYQLSISKRLLYLNISHYSLLIASFPLFFTPFHAIFSL